MNNILHTLARDYTATVFRVMKEHPGTLLKDAMEIASRQPAPRFYIKSYERATRYLAALLRGREPRISNPNIAAMYAELHRRYVRHQHLAKGRHVVDMDLLIEISEQPAPSFYRDATYLRTIFYEYQRHQL